MLRACRTFQAKLIENRATRHNGYQISQKKRPLIEKAFGWMKQTGGMRKTKLRGFILLVLVDCQTGSDSEPVSTVLSNKMYGLKSALTGGWTEIFGSPDNLQGHPIFNGRRYDPGKRFSFGHPNDVLSPLLLTVVWAMAQVLCAVQVQTRLHQNKQNSRAINAQATFVGRRVASRRCTH